MNTYHISCRRWFQKIYGNTYHSVRIYKAGVEMAHIPFQYGYDEGCLQTALDKLREMGEIPQGSNYGTRYIRETLHSTYEIIDVERKSDL